MSPSSQSFQSSVFRGRGLVHTLVSVPLLAPARHGSLQPQRVLPWREAVRLARNEAVTRHEPIPVVHDVAARHLGQGLEGGPGRRRGPVILHHPDLEQRDRGGDSQDDQHRDVDLDVLLQLLLGLDFCLFFRSLEFNIKILKCNVNLTLLFFRLADGLSTSRVEPSISISIKTGSFLKFVQDKILSFTLYIHRDSPTSAS